MTPAGGGRRIDRAALVGRHAVTVTGLVAASPMSVGNGELCFTVDATGLQTFPDHHPVTAADGGPPGTLLGTQSQWGWHSAPSLHGHDLAATRRTYRTPRGRVPYVDMRGEVTGAGEAGASAAESWLRSNPHRLDLARIGLVYATGGSGRASRPTGPPGPTGRAPDAAELTGVRQRLDLWTATVTSRFRLRGTPVEAVTACHPTRDVLALRISSELLAAGLAVRVAFPYGCERWNVAADWDRPQAHTSTVHPTARGCLVERTLDDTRYTVLVDAGSGADPRTGTLTRTGPHELLVTATGTVLDLVIGFLPGPPGTVQLPRVPAVLAASAAHWAAFWLGGGAVELAESRDERASELERRIVLSQYLTAIHCAGSRPPQETGLMVNSWRGRFHLEMHWWHGAHFPLWGRPELLERSLDWYRETLPVARETARLQGYTGVRWPKQVAPDGRESPSPIGPFLIWQQPHPIYLAELVRRCEAHRGDGRAALARYADLVLQTAAFLADFAVPGPRGYQLGPPLVPAQETYARQRGLITNPTFELAYWAWALRVAQRWRVLLGLAPDPHWQRVADGLARPAVRDGRYAAIDVPPYTVPEDHPSMLYALGFVPPTGMVEPATMRATLHHVLEHWRWETTWGWDYPAIAMTATRLGEPSTAVAALLRPTPKNRYLPNGHNPQGPELPVYLPGNGGLLAATALMATEGGFPHGVGWTVRHEGLYRPP